MRDINSNKSNAGGYVLACLAAAFLTLLTAMVLQQAPQLGEVGNRPAMFIGFMCFNVLLLLLGSLWSIHGKAHIQGFLTASSLLLGIGSAYQFLYDGYLKYLIMVLIGLVLGVVTYLFLRRHSRLPNKWFYSLVGLIVCLLVANFLWGTDYGTGARLWISFGFFSFQPGEAVKVLLILLGACAYRNTRRGLVYCACALGSCGALMLLRDLGGAVVVFGVFVLMTYLLFDSRKLSLGIITVAVLVFLVALKLVSYAAQRIDNWTHVMTLADTWQQREFITATLLGGFRGLGLGNAHHFTEIFASREDGAIAGVMAIYGVPMVCVAIGSYALLMAQPLYNRAVYPSNYLIMSQVSALIFCQVILNFAGSLDLLPFTGVNGPLISAGGSSAICFCVLLGMIAASLHPAVKTKKEE